MGNDIRQIIDWILPFAARGLCKIPHLVNLILKNRVNQNNIVQRLFQCWVVAIVVALVCFAKSVALCSVRCNCQLCVSSSANNRLQLLSADWTPFCTTKPNCTHDTVHPQREASSSPFKSIPPFKTPASFISQNCPSLLSWNSFGSLSRKFVYLRLNQLSVCSCSATTLISYVRLHLKSCRERQVTRYTHFATWT